MNYWECLTHECGSTNFNNLMRHEWEVCDIVKKSGTPKSKTWHNAEKGGLNGDISRKFYRDWDKFCLMKQQKTQIKDTWIKQYEANEEHVDKRRRFYNDYS